MKNIKIEMTHQELLLAITLMSDQLFRREFIDPKMPGYKGNHAEVALGKDLVLRLKAVHRQVSESPNHGVSRRNIKDYSTVTNGIPDAV